MSLGNLLVFTWRSREAFIWIAALLLLGFSDPASQHYTLCPFHNLGISFCPGCGLGRSITFFFHGMIAESFRLHPLGIPAVLLFIHRIYKVLKDNLFLIKANKPFNYG
jgi:hypothetical protein